MNVVHADISNGLQDVINLILQAFKYAFQFMRGIEFFGTNLFSFTITVFLLGVIFPIVFTLVESKSVRMASAANESLNKIKSRKSRAGSGPSSTELTTRN